MEEDNVRLVLGGSSCTISKFGAHVLSWKVAGEEQLFLSDKAVFAPPKAIRGGVPLIWPQFSSRGSLPSHGFARNKHWRVAQSGESSATFELEDDEETRKVYPPFVARFTVTLRADALELRFAAEPKAEPLSFTFALHTYFRVADIDEAAVGGLHGIQYQDQLKECATFTENRESITIAEEVDRVYLNAPSDLQIVTSENQPQMLLHSSATLKDVVVWNPWIAKAKRMGDFGDEEYHSMLCVEVGVINEPVKVSQGSTWEAIHTLKRKSNSNL